MDRLPRHRQAADFVPMDLGVRAARALGDRFGAQVLDYANDGRRASIRLRMPSRRELFSRSLERSRAAMTAAMNVRERTAETLERTEENRRRNHRLRSSSTEVRASLEAVRLESRRIRENLPSHPGPGEC